MSIICIYLKYKFNWMACECIHYAYIIWQLHPENKSDMLSRQNLLPILASKMWIKIVYWCKTEAVKVPTQFSSLSFHEQYKCFITCHLLDYARNKILFINYCPLLACLKKSADPQRTEKDLTCVNFIFVWFACIILNFVLWIST